MPNFQFQSLTTSGESRSGVLTASDRADAVRLLMRRGETAVQLLREGEKAKSPKRNHAVQFRATKSSIQKPSPAITLRRAKRPTVRRPEMANLIRELATAIEAGLPLMQSLKIVRKQASGNAMPVILDHLIERIEAGDTLHTAARDYGPPFDDMIVGMLRAADASGRMSEILHQLADLLERSVELRREVMGATIYPMIVAVLIAISATILVTVLVPRLIEPFMDTIRIPWPTQVVLGVANFLSAFWLPTLAGLGASWFAWRLWVNIPANRFRFDLALLRTPILGRLLRDVAVARFTRTLGTLSSSGLSILESLKITNATLGNMALMQAIDDVQDKVTAGKSLAEPLEQSGLFPPLLIQVINLGERTGKLEQMLLHAAKAFDRQVNVSINLFTKMLPPLLIIVMALLGGFVLAAIILPLLELQSMVG